MSENTSEANGGAHIKPSARKSIHSHCSKCTIGCHINMGKYGLKNRKYEEKSEIPSQMQGVDEVDNVMSKMARQASPIPTRRKNDCKYRRNSFDFGDEDTNEDSDDENKLSKSSPATFSCYSEELYTSALQNELQRSRNESSHSINNVSIQGRHNTSMNNSQTSSLTRLRQKENRSSKDSSSKLLVAVVIVILAVVVLLYKQFVSDSELTNNIYDKFRFDNDVKDLKEKYRVKDSSLLQVKTGVATIFENQDTASFIFAYNSNSNNFNPVKFNSFIEDIAATTSKYLRNESKEVHVTVDSTNLLMQSAKDFMMHYQDGVLKTGVMLVKDIDNIPSQLAMAFHYYCDEYNPLVKQSAIFFTMNLAKCSNSSDKKSTHEYIEKCLANKWNNVGEEKIGPLLTRVVNIVVDVTQTF